MTTHTTTTATTAELRRSDDDRLWRRLATVADVARLIGIIATPTPTLAQQIAFTLWRQRHRERARISHYRRRGEHPQDPQL